MTTAAARRFSRWSAVELAKMSARASKAADLRERREGGWV